MPLLLNATIHSHLQYTFIHMFTVYSHNATIIKCYYSFTCLIYIYSHVHCVFIFMFLFNKLIIINIFMNSFTCVVMTIIH